MSRRDGVNCGLVSFSVDVSHEDLRWHKDISFLLPPKAPPLIKLQPTIMNIIQWIPMITKIKITN